MKLDVNPQGFITNWLVSGPVCNLYTPPQDLPKTWTDQLGYEKALRSVFYKGCTEQAPTKILLNQSSPAGMPWRYYYNNRNYFVDASTFYSLITEIRLDASTVLCSPCAQTVSAILWTYGAVDLWLNGTQLLQADVPVYKPIRMTTFDLPLSAGENTIYVQFHNLGVRDTRNLFGLQLKNATDVHVSLPDAAHAEPFVTLEAWLSSLICKNGILQAPSAPPCHAVLVLPDKKIALQRSGSWLIPESIPSFTVHGTVDGMTLTRQFELLEHRHPHVFTGDSSQHRAEFFARLSEHKSEPRGNGIQFGVFNVLSRLFCKNSVDGDENLLLSDLDFIESCGDCSDFLVIGLLRLLHAYPDFVSPALSARIRTVLLSFRYWMDESGTDGMCFWSENHALMFYGSQLVAGAMYPDDIFTRSGRTGREQSEIGAARCRAWLDDVERDGVEEFNSASYLPVTLAALLHLVDFAPADISARAGHVMDSLLRQLCIHIFQNSVISPQGRVYRDVIYPYRQTVQSLLHMISADFPYSESENIWDICFATSHYRFPADLVSIAQKDAHLSYTSGNARVIVDKTADYILTSVQCPRDDDDAPQWKNLCFDAAADKNTNTYVKSLNERFHGTSVFEPGVYGYQQHLWYAAVSNTCVVFVNHPGSAVDFDGMRPGYWYGNGVFPAVLQHGNVLGAIYCIPENHPIAFTHVFWPTVKFDESRKEGQWLFGRSKNGYVGLWCSDEQVAHNDALSECEYRCYARNAAYFCICGSAKESDFAAFITRCQAAQPHFDKAQNTLFAKENYRLHFSVHENKTQYI